MDARRRLGFAFLLLYGGVLLFSHVSAWGAADPVEIPASQDVTIYSVNAADQWKGEGTRDTIQLGNAKDKVMRVLICFDLGDAAERPCGAAVLHLQSDECWPNKDAATIQVHRLIRPFNENLASWGHSVDGDLWVNPGGDMDPMPVSGRRLTKKDEGKAAKPVDIDVTPLVQAWQAKRAPNYGLVLCFPTECDSYIRFASKDSANAPKLQLYYASAPAKNPDMASASSLKPVGTMPKVKFEVYAANLNKGLVDADYKADLRARGGIAPYKWKADGLPEGLSMSEAGAISGKPAKAGTFVLAITVTGADGKSAASKVDLLVETASGKTPVLAGAENKKSAEPAKKESKKSGALDDE